MDGFFAIWARVFIFGIFWSFFLSFLDIFDPFLPHWPCLNTVGLGNFGYLGTFGPFLAYHILYYPITILHKPESVWQATNSRYLIVEEVKHMTQTERLIRYASRTAHDSARPAVWCVRGKRKF